MRLGLAVSGCDFHHARPPLQWNQWNGKARILVKAFGHLVMVQDGDFHVSGLRFPLLPSDVAIDLLRGLLAVGDGGDDQARPESYIAARKDSRHACHQRLGVYLDHALTGGLQVIARRQEREVRSLPDGQDHCVAVDYALAALFERWIEAVVRVKNRGAPDRL